MIYTVTFNPALDYTVHLSKFLQGSVNRTENEEIYYGGKGINVSLILNRLNIKNTAFGFVAGFTGKEIENGLKGLGVNTDFITLKNGMSRINVKIKSATETEINGQGPDISSSALEQLFEKLNIMQSGDTLVLSGSIPKTLSKNIYEQIMEKFQNKNVHFVVDATNDLLVNVLKYHPFLIKPNNFELGEIFGKVLNTDDEIADCAKKLQEKGARNVLVSMGGKGAMLIDENGKIHKANAIKGTVKNTVGSGDSMVAGFIAGYIQKHDYEYALKLGTAAGAATAFSNDLGAFEEISENFEKIKNL